MIERIREELIEADFEVDYDKSCNMITVYCDGYYVEVQDEEDSLILATYINNRLIALTTVLKSDWDILEGENAYRLDICGSRAHLSFQDRSKLVANKYGYTSETSITFINR